MTAGRTPLGASRDTTFRGVEADGSERGRRAGGKEKERGSERANESS